MEPTSDIGISPTLHYRPRAGQSSEPINLDEGSLAERSCKDVAKHAMNWHQVAVTLMSSKTVRLMWTAGLSRQYNGIHSC
jgi:hypothetical protein